MRKGLQNIQNSENNGYKIIAVDDEEGIVDSLSIFLKRSGYQFVGVTDPLEAIEKVKNEYAKEIANKYFESMNKIGIDKARAINYLYERKIEDGTIRD